MGIFSKLASASSTEGRNPFISRGGVTIDEVVRIRAGSTRDGDPFFAMDLEVVEVIANTPLPDNIRSYNEGAATPVAEGAHTVGEKVTLYVKIVNPFIENKLGNVKNAVEALMEVKGEDTSTWDEDTWDAAIMDKEQGIASGDGTLLAGTRVIRSSEIRLGVKSGNPYIVSTFAPAPAVVA